MAPPRRSSSRLQENDTRTTTNKTKDGNISTDTPPSFAEDLLEDLPVRPTTPTSSGAVLLFNVVTAVFVVVALEASDDDAEELFADVFALTLLLWEDDDADDRLDDDDDGAVDALASVVGRISGRFFGCDLDRRLM